MKPNSLFLVLGICLLFSGGAWLTLRGQEEGDPVSRSFQISEDALIDLLSGETVDAGGGMDPFAAPDPGGDSTEISDFQAHIGAELGIPFPEGTYVRHDPETGRLEINHVPGVVKAIEAYLRSLDQQGEKQINIRTEIYQMPARAALRVQQLSGQQNDHNPVWSLVQEMVESEQATFVNSGAVIARSGQRAKHVDIHEFIYPTEVDWNKEEDAVLPAAFETRDVGLIFEVDPVIGADNFTIDLNFSLEYHTAPPIMQEITTISAKSGRVIAVEMPEFHRKQIVTQITTGDGITKCIGAWRPSGKPEFAEEDLMQVAFLRTEIQVMNQLRPWEG